MPEFITAVPAGARAGNGTEPERLRKRVFVDDLSPRGVDEEGIGPHQRQPPRVESVPVGREHRIAVPIELLDTAGVRSTRTRPLRAHSPARGQTTWFD